VTWPQVLVNWLRHVIQLWHNVSSYLSIPTFRTPITMATTAFVFFCLGCIVSSGCTNNRSFTQEYSQPQIKQLPARGTALSIVLEDLTWIHFPRLYLVLGLDEPYWPIDHPFRDRDGEDAEQEETKSKQIQKRCRRLKSSWQPDQWSHNRFTTSCTFGSISYC